MTDKERVRQLYQSGLSTREVAERMGIAHSWTARICRDILRDKRQAGILGHPLSDSTHWRTMRNRARTRMERKLGRKLEPWEDVHHKDDDYTNNADENLELIHEVDHAHLHHPVNPVPRHQRPARQAYMREYLKTYRRAHS